MEKTMDNFRSTRLCIVIVAIALGTVQIKSAWSQSVDSSRTRSQAHATNAEVRLVPQLGHHDSVTSVAFSPDGRYVVTGSSDRTARLWDARSGAKVLTLSGQSEIESVRFSFSGRYVLTGAEDGTATLWDARSGTQLRVFDYAHETS